MTPTTPTTTTTTPRLAAVDQPYLAGVERLGVAVAGLVTLRARALELDGRLRAADFAAHPDAEEHYAALGRAGEVFVAAVAALAGSDADDFTIHDDASAVADAISGADRLYTSVQAARGFLFPFGLCEKGSEL